MKHAFQADSTFARVAGKRLWETTAHAGDEDVIFASDRLEGKQPRVQTRVSNMPVEDHLRPAAKQVIEIPRGHRFGFHNLRHAFASVPGRDRNRLQNNLALLSRVLRPVQL